MTNETNMPSDGPPPCPPWLDLDVIVSPELRQRMAAVTEEARALAVDVREWAMRAFGVSRDYDKAVARATRGIPVELHDLLSTLTGADKLFDAAVAMSNDVGAMTHNVDKPAWVDELAPEYIGKQLDEAVS